MVRSVLILSAALGAFAQQARIVSAPPNYLPAPVDSNSPAFWRDGALHIFTSTGIPLLSRGSNQFLMEGEFVEQVDIARMDHVPVWIEAAWMDDDGTLFLWYHHEPGGVCPNGLTAPVIGAAVSYDGGRTIEDLGVVLQAAEPPNCAAKNGFFAGGHGDGSVIKHTDGSFYIFFTTYSGGTASQGVAMARMSYEDRFNPAGAVWKYWEGGWNEPGLGGRVTPILPAKVAWEREDADSFWGPSLHWNTSLGSYVMLLNRACCKPGWPQEGIYASFNRDLANPNGWSAPKQILKDIGFGPGWYPQVLGYGPEDTDKQAGQKARLYIGGVSLWEIEFAP